MIKLPNIYCFYNTYNKYSGYCNLNTYENEEVSFSGQRSGEPLKCRQFDEISRDTIFFNLII